MTRLFLFFFVVLFFLITQSCAPGFNQPIKVQDARIGEESNQHEALVSLPKPVEPIYASVYKFRDQTGQYKTLENGSSFSTVVTQGATSILLKAMEDSGWFVPVERENQNNLLTERQLIRSSQQQYIAENPGIQIDVLPPLTYANILLEGGIISYDHNLITGGLGMRYFGIGGSTQYRQDRVTVYLRAVSTQTGQILKTVYVSKTILSQALDGNIFRYVRFQRILEAETGFSYNEPRQIVVSDAIEKALFGLIVEGMQEGLWSANASDTELAQIYDEYNEEKDVAAQTKVLNRFFDEDSRQGSVLSPMGTMSRLDGDYANPRFNLGAGLSARFPFTSFIAVQPEYSYKKVSIEDGFETNYSQLNAMFRYTALPFEELTPYFLAGPTAIIKHKIEEGERLFWGADYRVGAEFLPADKFGFYVEGGQTLLTSDQFDNLDQGRRNDFIWNIQGGFSYYLNKN